MGRGGLMVLWRCGGIVYAVKLRLWDWGMGDGGVVGLGLPRVVVS